LTNGTPADADQVMADFNALLNGVNGLDGANLTAALAALLGVSQAGSARRGKSIIATEESRTNVAYGLLATPDRVSSVVLPTDGLLCVAYQALWKTSVDGAGRAAVFIGSNQLVIGDNSGAPSTGSLEAVSSGLQYNQLASAPDGLHGGNGVSAGITNVTAGQVVGVQGAITTAGFCTLFAATGSYDVSVQFRSTSGSVTAKERKLWVWSMGF
jgi:hypothetical protein